jgi:hypothetical protein
VLHVCIALHCAGKTSSSSFDEYKTGKLVKKALAESGIKLTPAASKRIATSDPGSNGAAAGKAKSSERRTCHPSCCPPAGCCCLPAVFLPMISPRRFPSCLLACLGVLQLKSFTS